ncbi:flavohemoglobin expression-modulating QEGLA motif protein, partial [Candidatus Gracilibacteria bacterium]|nr:flavohemoglobin expression-modulating QEGLA motif protein [Candidatus Gracilibacteria bacterium]
LESKISQIQYYKERATEISKNVSPNKGNRTRLEILQGALQYVENTLYMSLYGLVFELEKAGHEHGLTHEEVDLRVTKIEKLEQENFGGKICDNTQEMILCYESLQEQALFSNKKKAKELEYFLEKIKVLLPKDYRYRKRNPLAQKDLGKVFQTRIRRDDYVKMFNLVFEIYQLPQQAKISSVSSIYDGEHFLEIPDSQAYAHESLKSILQLMLHEIMAHTVNLENTKRRLGEFRGANNLEKEEGLAVLLESLFQGYKLEDISIMSSFPALLLGEICSTQDFQKYLSLSYKNMFPRFLRFKRNYPKDLKGVQHKDTSYSRGILKAQKFLLEGGDMKDLFIGKVNFEDISLLKNIPLLSEEKPQIAPLMIAEVIHYAVKNGGKLHIHQDAFIKHLAKKYKFRDIDSLKISYSDPHVKKRICEILHILSKYISDIDKDKCDILFK